MNVEEMHVGESTDWIEWLCRKTLCISDDFWRLKPLMNISILSSIDKVNYFHLNLEKDRCNFKSHFDFSRWRPNFTGHKLIWTLTIKDGIRRHRVDQKKEKSSERCLVLSYDKYWSVLISARSLRRNFTFEQPPRLPWRMPLSILLIS